jgi:hypothetical protein
MPVHCYRQSWYKYRIRMLALTLICRDLRDQVVDEGLVRLIYGMD